MRSFWTGALAFGLTLASGSVLFAQRTTGGLGGTVKDSSGAVLPGVVVTVSGPNIVGVQSATTNESGFYRIINLPPGDYELKFTLGGFRTVTRRGLRVQVGATMDEGVTLEVSQLEESLDVVAESPVVDTTSNEVGSNYDRDWVENAPLRRYSFFDLVAAAPGALQGGDGSARTMVYGSGYDENAFQVDGVDITDNYFNEALAEPNTDAIEEVEVLSLGAPAEYGNMTGAVYNIVTRQGTNEYHGDLNFFWQGDGLTSNHTKDVTNPDGTFVDACGEARCRWTRDTFNDFTAQLGGPILKDKLWFFGSYGRQRDAYWDIGVPSTGPDAPFAVKNNEVDRYFFKLTWQATPKHKLVGTFHLDDQSYDSGLDIGYTPSTVWTRKAKTPTPGLAYTGVMTDKTVLDVRFSGFYGDVSGRPTDPDQPRDLRRFYDFDTGVISGGHYYWYDVEPTRTTLTAKVSHLADDFLGANHDFRFGVQYSDAAAQGIYGYNDFVYTYTYYGYRYGYGYDRQPFSYSGNSRSVGVFLDDTVKVSDRLSLNWGVRYDYSKAFAAEQSELDEFGQPSGTTFPEAELYTWNTISPRLGFNWKVTPDGKTVLKGHFGRYRRSIATGEFANVIGENVKPTFSGTYLFPENWDPTNPDLIGDFDPDSLELFEGNDNLSVDPDYESPINDQFILGVERELFAGFGANVNYVYKRGRKLQAWEDTVGQYVQVPFTDDLGDNPTGQTLNVFQLVSDAGDRNFRITNPPGVETDVHAVSFGLLKRMTDKWMLNASATWLRGSGRIQESASGVGIQQRSGLQFRDFGKNPNDFVNTDGRLRLDVTWNLKVQFVYQFPAGFLASANFSHRDNAWLVRRARVPGDVTNIPEGTIILLEQRGNSGRLPSVTFLDFRLQKDFKLGESVKLSVFADALNLTNENAPETVQSSLVTSSVFNWPLDPVDPRRVMLGAKLRF
jgi:outer membrane receptor protein involved in Fe transport